MTEQITRGYFEIIRELFFATKDEKGKPVKSALEQYAKVRHTKYELDLWRFHGLTLSQIDSKAKAYFSERFLNGKRILDVDNATLEAAYKRLKHAVDDGCHGRCVRLLEELNRKMRELKLEPVKIEEFLDFLTFNYRTRDDGYGYPRRDPDYGYEIRDFVDEYYRAQFREELKLLERTRRMMSMQDVLKIIRFKQGRSVILKKK